MANASKLKFIKVTEELAEMFRKYVNNCKSLKKLKDKEKKLKKDNESIFESVRPLFKQKTSVASVDNFLFQIGISGNTSISYKTLYEEMMTELAEKDPVMHKKYEKRKDALTKPPSTEALEFVEINNGFNCT